MTRAAILVLAVSACTDSPATTTAPTTTSLLPTTTGATVTVPSTSTAPPTATTQPTTTITTSPPSSCSSRCLEISEEISRRLDESSPGGDSGFYAVQVGGPPVAVDNWATPFYPASAIKVLHLLHTTLELPRLEDGLNTTVPVYSNSCSGDGSSTPRPLAGLLTEMMIDSNNESTNAIQDFFGREAMAETIVLAGMQYTELNHRFGCGGPANDPANRSTASDLARLYLGVADGSLLSSEERDLLLGTMIDAPGLLGPRNTSGAHVYLKTGIYGTTRTIGGLVVIPAGAGGGVIDQWAFAAFVEGAAQLAAGFDITDVVTWLAETGAFDF